MMRVQIWWKTISQISKVVSNWRQFVKDWLFSWSCNESGRWCWVLRLVYFIRFEKCSSSLLYKLFRSMNPIDTKVSFRKPWRQEAKKRVKKGSKMHLGILIKVCKSVVKILPKIQYLLFLSFVLSELSVLNKKTGRFKISQWILRFCLHYLLILAKFCWA